MSNSSKAVTAVMCIAFGGIMYSVPYVMRMTSKHNGEREKLSGSQRQRGMYLNAGSQDAGIDPDWDPVTHRWTGFDKKKPKLEDKSASS